MRRKYAARGGAGHRATSPVLPAEHRVVPGVEGSRPGYRDGHRGGWLRHHHHRPRRTFHEPPSKLTPALAAARDRRPGPGAGRPSPPRLAQDLNPPPPDFYTCKPLGAGTICTRKPDEVKVEEPHPVVCGSGADAFVIHDNGARRLALHAPVRRRRQLRRARDPRELDDAIWSNPLSGKTVPYTQRGTITDVLTVPGDSARPSRPRSGENVYTDPVTHKKVLRSAGRTVFGPDGDCWPRPASSRSSTCSTTATVACSTASARRSRSATQRAVGRCRRGLDRAHRG